MNRLWIVCIFKDRFICSMFLEFWIVDVFKWIFFVYILLIIYLIILFRENNIVYIIFVCEMVLGVVLEDMFVFMDKLLIEGENKKWLGGSMKDIVWKMSFMRVLLKD